MRHDDGNLRHAVQSSELFAVRVTYVHPVLGYSHVDVGIFHLHYATAKATGGVLQRSRHGFFDVVAALHLDILMGDANQAVAEFADILASRGVHAQLLAGQASGQEFTTLSQEGYDCMGIWGLKELRKDLTSTPEVPPEGAYNYAGRCIFVGVSCMKYFS